MTDEGNGEVPPEDLDPTYLEDHVTRASVYDLNPVLRGIILGTAIEGTLRAIEPTDPEEASSTEVAQDDPVRQRHPGGNPDVIKEWRDPSPPIHSI